ncbi:MAG: diaminopimelate decarboxylase [Bacteroidales bacterium]|nr:diaminopimelate decarboxylase [Bacteroidales bacterium]
MYNHNNKFQTPSYIYNLALLEETIRRCIQYSSILKNNNIFYAIKANYNEDILKIIRKNNFGAECVSLGEINLALKNSFLPDKIIFSGIGKTLEELNFAIENNIGFISVENIEELKIIDQISSNHSKKTKILLRINPNINVKTHKYITTGNKINKFGLSSYELSEIIPMIHKFSYIQLMGLHFHIGSQITDMQIFKNLCSQINDIVRLFENNNINIKIIDVGGGLGIDYHEPDKNKFADFYNYFTTYKHNLNLKPNQEVFFELGRSIVGQCGTLISKVIYLKKREHNEIIILDTSISHFIRPALYNAYHKIINLSKSKLPANTIYDVYGSSCESSDIFGQNILLPITDPNDILAIKSTGAYCEVMISDYNLKKRPYVLTTNNQCF